MSSIADTIVGKIFANNVSLSSRKVKLLAECHYILDLLGSLSRDRNPCSIQSHLLEESCLSPTISRFQYKGQGQGQYVF